MSYTREDRKGAHRANYERNRKRIFATQKHLRYMWAPSRLQAEDATPNILNSDVEEYDQLHSIVKRILKRNRRRKGIVV